MRCVLRLGMVRVTMAAKKRKPKSLRPTDRPMPVVSTAVAGLINMAVTAVTSGTVLLCLLRLSDYSDAMRTYGLRQIERCLPHFSCLSCSGVHPS